MCASRDMRRKLSYRKSELNDSINVMVLSEMNNIYEIDRFNDQGCKSTRIDFQDRLTDESLLAILIDRLLCFQESGERCWEYKEALRYLEAAMKFLQDRKERLERERFVQTKNPRSGQWVKIDTKLGRVVSHKATPYKNVKFAEKVSEGIDIVKGCDQCTVGGG